MPPCLLVGLGLWSLGRTDKVLAQAWIRSSTVDGQGQAVVISSASECVILTNGRIPLLAF